MAKKAPSGLGLWIAFESMITPGKSVRNTVTRAKAMGAKWVAVRGGGNRSADKTRLLRDAELPVGAIEEFKDAGLDVYVWVFSYPELSLRQCEIALYKDFVAEGADGIIINAEVSWKVPQANAIAQQHVKDIRAALGDVWVSHAPFALPNFHQDFPYIGFSGLDAILTQLYWTEFGDAGLKPWLERYTKQWADYKAKNPAVAAQPVHPIGVTYGKELGKKWGLKQVPPGEFHIADLELFMDTFADDPMPSLYTLEAMHDDARDYLIARAGNQPATEDPEMPENIEDKTLEVHLPAQGKTLRANTWGQAYRLTEEAPKFDGTVESALKIVSWLGVEKGGRWQPIPGITYCNVYAHDLCNLMGAYVPRVWWNNLEKTNDVILGKTVHELSANALFSWFKGHSEKFGWNRVHSLDELQAAANRGHACVIVARNRNEQWSGHISCVVGESQKLNAHHDASGKVTLPVQSQAGAKCYELSNISSWWTSGTFMEYGFWVHDPQVDVIVDNIEPAVEIAVNPQLISTIIPPPMEPTRPDISAELANVPETPGGFFGTLITFLLKLIAAFTKR